MIYNILLPFATKLLILAIIFLPFVRDAWADESLTPTSSGVKFRGSSSANSSKTLTATINKTGMSFLSLLGLNILTAPASANGSACNAQAMSY